VSKQGYAAESDPPEGARPARDTGVRDGTRLAASLALLIQERDEARAAARDYLPHVKFSYDDLNQGKRYERAERERLPWLGPPETPLEDR
jgi:hypothetical protein